MWVYCLPRFWFLDKGLGHFSSPMAIWKGSHNPILRGRILTMVISHRNKLGAHSPSVRSLPNTFMRIGMKGPTFTPPPEENGFFGVQTPILTRYLGDLNIGRLGHLHDLTCGWRKVKSWKTQPGDLKWPFYPLVGGHLSFERVTFSISQKGHKEMPGTLFVAISEFFMFPFL